MNEQQLKSALAKQHGVAHSALGSGGTALNPPSTSYAPPTSPQESYLSGHVETLRSRVEWISHVCSRLEQRLTVLGIPMSRIERGHDGARETTSGTLPLLEETMRAMYTQLERLDAVVTEIEKL